MPTKKQITIMLIMKCDLPVSKTSKIQLLSKGKILNFAKFKALADENINVTQKFKFWFLKGRKLLKTEKMYNMLRGSF